MRTFRWLTPPAPAAIAVVRLEWAGDAPGVLFDREVPEVGRARFARLLDGRGGVVDEVVVARLGPGMVDCASHGGIGMRLAVEAALQERGWRLIAGLGTGMAGAGAAGGSGEEHGGGVWWERLARAPAPAAARWLMRAMATEVAGTREGDAGGGPVKPPFPPAFLERAPVVLVTGAVNAGKSTLINAWCGRPRALVSAVPGTTRDLLAAEALCCGWQLRLLDSAGLRAEPGDALEGAGMVLAVAARAQADVVVHLRPPGDIEPAIPGALVVQGKADLVAAAELRADLPVWSAVGIAGRSPAELVQRLGWAVLERLGLPAEAPTGVQ